MTDRIRVLHVLRQASGGMRVHVTTLLRNMDRKRYSLMVACPRNTIVDGDLLSLGIKLFYVNIGEGINPLVHVKSFLHLMRIMKENSIQVVHCHGARAGIIGRAAAILTGTPVIIYTVHNFVYQGTAKGWGKWLLSRAERLFQPTTSKYIVVSRALAAEMIKNEGIPAAKINVVYNGVNLDNFNIIQDCVKKKEQLGLNPHAVIIGTAGRLIATKGVFYFIKAARLVREKFPVTQFLVVGEGPERPALLKLVKNLEMENHILFLGYRTDLPAILPLISVFVVPTISEGQSIVTLEAMAARRPIVAFETGGIPELLHHYRTGILVREKDSRYLAKGIIEVLENPLLAGKIANRARYMVEKKFRQETMIQRTEEIYRQCLEEKGFFIEPLTAFGDKYIDKLTGEEYFFGNKQ